MVYMADPLVDGGEVPDRFVVDEKGLKEMCAKFRVMDE
jgi:hypothetical protein